MSAITAGAAPTHTSEKGASAAGSKRSILLLAKYSGLFALARLLTSRRTRILAYHGIWLGEGSFGNFLYMSAEKFAARMALLYSWGYPVVPLSDRDGRGRCKTVITIDDGWYGTWAAMLPVLEHYGYPATVYLASYYCENQSPVIDVALQYCFAAPGAARARPLHLPGYQFGPVALDTATARQRALAAALEISAALEGDAARQEFLKAVCEEVGVDHARLTAERWFHLMNPAEVQDAARRGVSFESHTHRHRIAHRGESRLAEEIAANRASIQALVGRAPRHFCYPSGRYTRDLWPILEQCQMVSATTTDTGLAAPDAPRYALPRILDGQDVSELEFEAEMSGFMELSRILRRVFRG